ncbi:MAG TPA: PEP-CTERM sorting domain-containing protein [Acidobacteriaceae bacterium]|jgi:hypothetical protein|nr:PEP-CTERM sorting domain-containing protein [Acidobacteriaceae bacterium]
MPSKILTSISIAIFGLASTLVLSSAHAATITYTGTGSGSDGSLSASAAFTTSAGSLQVTLTDLLSASVIRSQGQALSDITFTLSNAAGTLGTTSASGQLGNVSSTGVVTYTTGTPTRWLGTGGGAFSVSGSTVALEAIGGGQPTEMIAPTIANGGTYTNVVQGFQNFDPYVIGPATFSLALSGVTSSTTITGVTFSFGTGPDTFVTGVPSTTPPATPEPSSLALLGTGLLGAVTLLRRKFATA